MDSYHTMPDAKSANTLLCCGTRIVCPFEDPDEAEFAAYAMNKELEMPVSLGPVEIEADAEAFAEAEPLR
jgi:hypothetical protein